MPSSSDQCFVALAAELGLLPREQLELALAEAKLRGRPIERHLVETKQLTRDVSRTVEISRTTLARGCTVCRKVTYLLPNAALSQTPCEHCGGALAAATRPDGKISDALKKVDPKSGVMAKPDPKSGAMANPTSSAPATSPADPKSGSQAAPKASPPSAAKPEAPAAKPATTPAAKPATPPAAKPATPPAAKPAPSAGVVKPATPAARTPAPTAPKSDRHDLPKAVAQAPKAEPKSGPHAAPKAEPKGGPHAAPKAEPKSGPHAAPKAEPKSSDRQVAAGRPKPVDEIPAEPPPELAPPALVDDDEDWAPLPPWVGRCRVEALLCESDTVFVYSGRIVDDPVAVRSLKPELVGNRRAVDMFFRAAQAATEACLLVVDLGTDGAGVPFLAVARSDDDASIGERLRDLTPSPSALGGKGTKPAKSDTGSLVFAQLQRQRQELSRQVAENSRRRDRCLGQFVLLEEVSQDAGSVWRAFDTGKDEVVTVRVLEAGAAAEGGKLQKALNEVLTAAGRLRNPQVAQPRAHGVDGQRLFIARAQTNGQPFTGGPTLEAVLKQAQEAAQSLAYLHAQGLAHGGIHPGTLLVDGAGHVTLVDVGLAAALQASGKAGALPWRLARAGCTPLSGADAPPPVTGDTPLGGSTSDDIFALGAVLYRAASSFIPDAIAQPASPPDRAADALAVALRCLSADPSPSARYASMTEVARDLERVLEGQVPLARQALAPKPVEDPAKVKPGSSVVGTLSGVFKRLLGR